MAYFTSLGGNVYLQTLLVPVGQWTGNWTSRLSEVSVSSSTSTRFAPVIPHNAWTISMPVDDPAFPDVMGFVQGTILSEVYFKQGASNRCYLLQNTTVEQVNPVCNPSGDVLRVEISGMGGDLTADAAVPA